LDLNEVYKLKEYDNLRKIMIEMKNNNFPYVSYLEGGFEGLHRESLKYKIELVDHDKNKCKLCKKIQRKETFEEKQFKKLKSEEKTINLSETLWKNGKVITEKELNCFFSNENNVVLICNLIKYKEKYYHKGDIEIFIAIFFDKKIIEFYKNDSKIEKTIDNKDDKNYYNLGIKGKKNNFFLRLFEEIQFANVQKAIYKKNYKNIIILKAKNNGNPNNKSNNIFEMEFEFYSFEDSKTFLDSIIKLKTKNFNLFS
jgi:hypothetical protein